jgi:hypothetical protein
MKKFIFTSLLISSFISKGMAQAVIADPAVNLMHTISLTTVSIDPFFIPIDSVITLKVPVINYNLANGLPSGTCKIKIGLGSKMVLDSGFDLSTVNTSNYFQWTAALQGGQIQITGDLVASLPANFADTVTFHVKGSVLGSSTITTNFLVTNHNSTITLSDENGTNNNTSLAYNIIQRTGGPTPVDFTKVWAVKQACNVSVNFNTENEINVGRFEIEVSRDAVHFEKVGELAAARRGHYNVGFGVTDQIAATQLFVRIKSVDLDGKYQYSEIIKISGTCAEKERAIIIFPNPAPRGSTYFTVRSENHLFDGNYDVSVSDVGGKLVSKRKLNLSNTSQFKYDHGSLPAGDYIVQITGSKSGKLPSVKWQKR